MKSRYPHYTGGYEVRVASGIREFMTQRNTSYYTKVECYEDGTFPFWTYELTEENCALTAIYNLFNIWSVTGIVRNIPTGTVDISESIKNEILYYDYHLNSPVEKSSSFETGYFRWQAKVTNLRDMPVLYSEIREHAVNNRKYTPISGYRTDNVLGSIYHVGRELHNNYINPEKTTILGNVHMYLEQGKACYMAMYGSSCYGSHAVALIGYKVYSYTSGWWIFSSTHYAYFYEIADGWSNKPMYFDPNTGNNVKLEMVVLP